MAEETIPLAPHILDELKEYFSEDSGILRREKDSPYIKYDKRRIGRINESAVEDATALNRTTEGVWAAFREVVLGEGGEVVESFCLEIRDGNIRELNPEVYEDRKKEIGRREQNHRLSELQEKVKNGEYYLPP